MNSNSAHLEKSADSILEAYYQDILDSGNDEDAIKEYDRNLERVRLEFIEKTRIQGADLGFLFFAVMLQCARIYIIDRLTEIETANMKGGKEDKLHEFQDKVFTKFNPDNNTIMGDLYSPLSAIVSLRGVPYDATGAFDETIKKMHIFKGANHRFATLGHDPVLGLVFGTANILTSTITTTRKSKLFPTITTYHVVYDAANKNPRIAMPVPTVQMLKAACDRFSDDKKSVVAAVIKQLIHIATDLYTPCGIQLPGANLVLSNTSVERITQYISTGDVIKVGASASTAMLINCIVSAVHGCKLVFDKNGAALSDDLYQARTRKVVMYSNIIATSSNVVSAALSKDVKKLDVGGMLVTLYRIFNDTAFIGKLEEEFINTEVSKPYIDQYEKVKVYFD